MATLLSYQVPIFLEFTTQNYLRDCKKKLKEHHDEPLGNTTEKYKKKQVQFHLNNYAYL